MYYVTEFYFPECEVNFVKPFTSLKEAKDFLKTTADNLLRYEKEQGNEEDLVFEITENLDHAKLSKYDGALQWIWNITEE